MTEDDGIRFMIRMGLSKCSRALFREIAKKHTPDLEYAIAADRVLEQIRLSGYDVVRVAPMPDMPKAHGVRP